MSDAKAHITLAIETSNSATGAGEVAIGRRLPGEPPELLAVETLEPAGRHDDALAPAIDKAVKGASLTPAQIDRVAVSVGPGGFTSLRIAVVSAKMIAEAVGAECVAVPSALVAAHGLFAQEKGSACVCVAMASKHDSAWCAHVDRNDPVSAQAASAAIGEVFDAQGLAESLESKPIDALIADAHLPESLRTVVERADVPVYEPTFWASVCLELSWFLAGVEPLAIEPIYPRQPEAVTNWRRLHG
jgi:tRNA threonylcarbamoyl adenosine modification protein YeaZ